MSRTTKPGLPDVSVVHEVIRLDELLIAAERRTRPTGAVPARRLPEYDNVFRYLSGLPDDRMTEIHALFWLGNQPSSTARAYDALYQHAANNLDDGAAYLAGRPLAVRLRRALAKLGLPPDPISARLGDHLHPVT